MAGKEIRFGQEARASILEGVNALANAVKVTLDKTPPELSADIMEQGVVLAGGGALLHGISERLEHETGMPIIIAQKVSGIFLRRPP